MKAKSVKIGAIRFASRRDAARYMLKRYPNKSRSEIARRLNISQPCVTQCALGY